MSRKLLQRLSLIQWACFQNEVARMSGSTLFTGVNGSGKSTILDAVSYLLTANTSFNAAAKDRDRTVKGYVRGDTKSNGKDQFLRSGEVVSYLAGEFVSETDASTFVIGVCIESPGPADPCTSSWFIFRDTALEDVRMAEEENRILSVYPRRQLTVKGKPVKQSDFMGREKARAQIIRVLGLHCDAARYRGKLVKMMAFNPENNVDQFIQKCVLEAGGVYSLKELREQKERFEELKGIYENLKISRDKLDIVESRTTAYENQNRQFRSRTLMLRFQETLFCRDERERIHRELEQLRQQLSSVAERGSILEERRKAAQERYDNARSGSRYMDVSSSLESIRHQMDLLEGEIRINRQEVRKLSVLSKRIQYLKDILKEDWQVPFEDEKVLADLGGSAYDENAYREKLLLLTDRLEKLLMRYTDRRYELLREERDAERRRSEVEDCLRELENRKIPYPKKAERTRQILQQELSRIHRGAQVRFFAELVQAVRDPSWRKAVETFLGRKRFFLIVDDAYVSDALQILHDRKLRDTSLVMTDKLPETEVRQGSAAEILDIPSKAARRYANYLLNGIHLCDSAAELHEYPKGGLTRTGMLAKGYAAAMMDMTGTLLFLGTDAAQLQLKVYQEEQAQLKERLKTLHAQIDSADARIQAVKAADIRPGEYHFSAALQLQENEQQYRLRKKEREALEQDPGFRQILEEVNRARKLLDELMESKSLLDQEKGRLESETGAAKEREKTLAGEALLKKNQYEEYLALYPELEQEMKSDYERLRKRSDSARVIKSNTVEKLRTDTDRAKTEMENAQLDYLKSAGMNLEKRGVSFIPFFHEEKQLISNVRIEEASNKLEQHAKEMESTFMTDFVAELNESINSAKREVASINEALRHLPFGNDTYEFRMEEREDRREFFRICRKLNDFGSVEMLQGLGAGDEELSHDIRSFMDLILQEQDENEFTDYRRYFKYDMKIRTKRGEQEIEADFSKKQGSASNGEKQTPYFIILAASLIQCYPRETECARLAFIDEAFAALSRERIEQMVNYLEDNQFQVLYAAPPEKISSIGDLINTTVSLVPTGRYTKLVEGLVR